MLKENKVNKRIYCDQYRYNWHWTLWRIPRWHVLKLNKWATNEMGLSLPTMQYSWWSHPLCWSDVLNSVVQCWVHHSELITNNNDSTQKFIRYMSKYFPVIQYQVNDELYHIHFECNSMFLSLKMSAALIRMISKKYIRSHWMSFRLHLLPRYRIQNKSFERTDVWPSVHQANRLALVECQRWPNSIYKPYHRHIMKMEINMNMKVSLIILCSNQIVWMLF